MKSLNQSSSLRAYKILRIGFIALPLMAGVDKLTNRLVDWTVYLSPLVSRVIDAHVFMKVVGCVEIAAGALTIINPRAGGYLIAVWLWGIILNLLTIPGYYDIALRDFGLSLGALALAQLAQEHPRDF